MNFNQGGFQNQQSLGQNPGTGQMQTSQNQVQGMNQSNFN